VGEHLKKRFLVLHDYGMGGSWWWIRARSEWEIAQEFAEVATDRDGGSPVSTLGWRPDECEPTAWRMSIV
jgi:hypothetical protein